MVGRKLDAAGWTRAYSGLLTRNVLRWSVDAYRAGSVFRVNMCIP
jgi:hypothetical protein